MDDTDRLTIPLEKICFIMAKARQFDGKDVLTDPGASSNATDDGMRSVLEDHASDPVHTELTSCIWALNDDEKLDLVTLAWLGRGDGLVADWDALRAEAARSQTSNAAHYVLGMPLLADYLSEALAQFGLSCADLSEGDEL